MSLQVVLRLTTFLLPFLVGAHVRLLQPKPYGPNTVNWHDPMTPEMFPCKHTYDGTDPTAMKTGDTQPLTFHSDDTATHGGGSCQLSISKNMSPNSSVDFRVFKSFIGECPASFTAEPHVVTPRDDMTFKIPKSIPNGDAIFAWTWTSCKTNEFFMSCAPVTISGGAEDTTEFNTLPNIIVANLDEICRPNTTGNYTPVYPTQNQGPDPTLNHTDIAQQFNVVMLDMPAACTSAFPRSGSSNSSGSSGSSGATPTPTPSTSPCSSPQDGFMCHPTLHFYGTCQNSNVTWILYGDGHSCTNGKGLDVP
ncbi:lytic polysaccharide monooxygenase [Lophiostoma macrostomum CBS 122681]|uniref:Lytic polysaccharide monooxygenase n=1 Tax=Lophiostoma macrostomum CBS 122681 TaxID=1314788 RepID=A0A6A6TGU2_9PLEO|nr:lytic polysaccharide monooxygenase [Lophiostoma macrostomum CBS 122681]